MKQALDRLKDLSADADARRLAFVRERALRDEVSELRAEREKGKTEGEGFALQRLLVKRFGALPAELASRIEGASPAEIEVWLDRVLDAGCLAEVFDPPAH